MTTMEPIQVVEFDLGKEHFAIDLFDVREVVEKSRITQLPNSPIYVRGIIDLRGEITTIIDLKKRLNITAAEEENAGWIIILDQRAASTRMGVLVDDVTSVSTFERDQVDSNPLSTNDMETAIRGIIKKKVRVKEKEINELIIWIDIKKLVGDIDTSGLAQAAPA